MAAVAELKFFIGVTSIPDLHTVEKAAPPRQPLRRYGGLKFAAFYLFYSKLVLFSSFSFRIASAIK